jgi:SAM-dependent methyltransferase
LYYLKSKGYANIEGVDIGDLQIGFLKKMGIDGTTITSIPRYLEDKKDRYDMVIMNHVIEHFSKTELWGNLKAIHASLKTGGVFIFSTPNMACLSGLFERNVDFTHETGFTERNAYQVMRITGFRHITIKGDRIKLKARPKRIAWWALNILWRRILGFAYYLERGSDRPRILSRSLIVSGTK